ncbi:MAG: HNH endonuclease [Elusimicrobiota bacterium]
MVMIKNSSIYRRKRLIKLARRDGYEIINGEMYAFCYICDREYRLECFTIDHYQARYNGGTNRLSNLRICCRECNEKKAENERPALPHPRIYYIFIRPIRKFIRRKLWELKNESKFILTLRAWSEFIKFARVIVLDIGKKRSP